jgi:hypothetical protein
MTTKLPRCETLPDLPGGPSFGWHMQNDGPLGCYEKDMSMERLSTTHTTTPIRSPEGHMRMVNCIAGRGENRVVFTRKIK